MSQLLHTSSSREARLVLKVTHQPEPRGASEAQPPSRAMNVPVVTQRFEPRGASRACAALLAKTSVPVTGFLGDRR